MTKSIAKFVSNKSGTMHCDQAFIDNKGDILYASLIGESKTIKGLKRDIDSRKGANVKIGNKARCFIAQSEYNISTKQFSSNNYSHAIITLKDVVQPSQDDISYFFVIIRRENEDINKLLYDKLKEHTTLPMLEEWMPALITAEVTDKKLLSAKRYHQDYPGFDIFTYQTSKKRLVELITFMLRLKMISVEGSHKGSDKMSFGVNGLDDYLEAYGKTIAVKTQESFRAKFDVSKDSYTKHVDYIDDFIYGKSGITLYDAQKTVIQSAVNNLNINDFTFICGEMGTGKTVISSAITYAHNAKRYKGHNTIIMCPSHLTRKWKSEIERFVPNSKAHIISDFKDLIDLKPHLTNEAKIENTYVIVSKDKAKIGYDMKPAVQWSKLHDTFVCPKCGKPLYTTKKDGNLTINTPFNKLSMKKKLVVNSYCMNSVETVNEETKAVTTVRCNNPLWGPLNRDDKTDKWMKLGPEGWIMKQHVEDIATSMLNEEKTSVMTTSERKLFVRIVNQYNKLQNNEDVTSSCKGIKKYPLSKYIRERMNDVFDYAIIDECHQYKSLSIQGQAAADLIQGCKKSLLLTGTLLNGYADGLFYLLYRTCPKVMMDAGYRYSDESRFARDFGVTQVKTIYDIENPSKALKTPEKKRLPGVSPLMFSKFLLNNSVFVSLSDMSEGLPGYKEIPVGIDLDDDVAVEYDNIENTFRTLLSGEDAFRMASSFLRLLTNYPDAPHCARSIIDYETSEVLYEPELLLKERRNKENKLIELVTQKIDKGEKVLVYYTGINTTDIAPTIVDRLDEQGISSFELKSNIKSEDRAEYIEKQMDKGAQVMICNPALVETGLDLLDFTTIIFYQLGYSIFTMRQASRRSWRLSQDKDVEVYFMYYKNTLQEQILSLMATKLHASLALEGKFSEEGLRAMSENEDLTTKLANNLLSGIRETVTESLFKPTIKSKTKYAIQRDRKLSVEDIEYDMTSDGLKATPLTQYIYKDIEKDLAVTNKFNYDLSTIF